MRYNPYRDFVNDMFAKRHVYKKQGKDLLQTLAGKIANSVYDRNIRRVVNCVTQHWINENYDDRVKKRKPLKNGNLIVKLEDVAGVDDVDIAKKKQSNALTFRKLYSRSL